MAKFGKASPRRRGKFDNYMKGQIEIDLPLSTLAASTLVRELVADTVTEPATVSSIVCTYAMTKYSPAQGAGPIQVYVAHSDYTIAEIEEVIENQDSWSMADRIARERSKRWVRHIGTFDTPANAAENAVLNDGKPIRTKLNWALQGTQTLQFAFYNDGSVALATTSPECNVRGYANLWQH